MTVEDSNFKTFSSAKVVELYANSRGIHPAEAYVFDRFIPNGASILDIGVGGGRTTPYLAAKAGRYVGVDYVKAMIEKCAGKFPQHRFFCADARKLIEFDDASFDVIVFSFNGIDAIPTIEGRRECLLEAFRLLSTYGLFIFSSHNSRMLFSLPRLDNAGLLRKVWRLVRAAISGPRFTIRLLQSGVFRAGAGYYLDPVHGGVLTYCSTPELIEIDAGSTGFRLLEVISNLHPQMASRYFVTSYYYVLAKSPGTHTGRGRDEIWRPRQDF